jgi:phosphotransferase system HPr (HPr) family protein
MNSAPLQRKVLLANPNGLHMRPSAVFVQTAARFQSSVTVMHDGKSANGKSILDLIGLGAEHGCELTLEADGPDADTALEALSALLSTAPPPVED